MQIDNEDGSPILTLPLGAVRECRLAVEMAGQESQIVCRLKTAAGEQLAIGSRTWQAPGQWRNRADTFGGFLRDLHVALEPHDAQIRYLEGQTLAFMMIMFGLGLVLAVMGLVFLVVLFFVQENTAGLFLIPVVVLGGWLARMFWPRPPRVYDPTTYRRDADA